jgi:hypothetical protein
MAMIAAASTHSPSSAETAEAAISSRTFVRRHAGLAHLQIPEHLVHVQRVPGSLLDLADVPDL